MMKVKKEFKKGDRVKIYNQTLSGEDVLEGIAVVENKVGGENYNVRFESDGFRCERNLDEAEKV